MRRCTASLLILLAAAAPPSRPDVLFILSDDLGIGEVGFAVPNTNKNISTPHIDTLAASGMIFNSAYTGAPVCAPSRGTLLTMRHTGHATIRGNKDVGGHDFPLRADPEDVTFLSVLAAAGYHVSCVGKWGVGWISNSGSPVLKGCTDYYGVLDQNEAHDMYPSDANFTWRWPAANGSAAWEALPFPANANASRAACMAPGNACVWSHDLWTQAALLALASHSARRAAAGAAAPPLFLYVAYTDPHAGGWQDNDAEEGNPVPDDGNFTNAGWPVAERDHASVIQNYQDRDVGALVAAADAAGAAPFLKMFASDNGASNEGHHDYLFFNSSGPLRGFKRCLTEGGIRTPFAASWPGVIAPGSSSAVPIAFYDVGPTVLELAGVPRASWPAGIDGISFAPLLLGGDPAPYANKSLYWEFCTAVHPPLEPRSGPGWGHALRRGPWKIVSFFADQPVRLYNLDEDVYEVHDLAAQHPDIVTELTALAKAAHVDSADFPVAGCTPS